MGYYYDMWFFVEGTDALGLVTILNDKAVYVLKGEIIKQLSNTYCNGIDAWQLEILKVCYLSIFSCCSNQHSDNFFQVDIDRSIHQDATHELQVPDATEVDSMSYINQIWLNQPDRSHLHICVRLPGQSTSWSTYSLTNVDTFYTRNVLTEIPFAVVFLIRCFPISFPIHSQ